jgi:hypothetical protein
MNTIELYEKVDFVQYFFVFTKSERECSDTTGARLMTSRSQCQFGLRPSQNMREQPTQPKAFKIARVLGWEV